MQFSYVYILTNFSRDFLYIGATDDLPFELSQHTFVQCSAFSTQARPVHLIYFESFKTLAMAEIRAEQLKKWRDSQKWKLIMQANPCLHELLWLEAEILAA